MQLFGVDLSHNSMKTPVNFIHPSIPDNILLYLLVITTMIFVQLLIFEKMDKKQQNIRFNAMLKIGIKYIIITYLFLFILIKMKSIRNLDSNVINFSPNGVKQNVFDFVFSYSVFWSAIILIVAGSFVFYTREDIEIKSQSSDYIEKSQKSLFFSDYKYLQLRNYLITPALIFVSLVNFLSLSNSSAGEYLGGDIKVFASASVLFQNFFSTSITSYPDLGGIYPSDKGAQYVQVLESFLSLLSSDNSGFVQRAIIYLIYFVAIYSIFLLLQYFKVNYYISLIGAFGYGFSPLFFNYVVFGWWYVALSYAVLPFFIKVIFTEFRKPSKSVTLFKFLSIGLFSGLFIYSSNLYLIFFLVFTLTSLYLQDDNHLMKFFKIIKINLVFFIGTLIPNTNWILSRLIYRNSSITKGDGSTLGQVAANEWHTGLTGFGITYNNSFFQFNEYMGQQIFIFANIIIILSGFILIKNETKDWEVKVVIILISISVAIGFLGVEIEKLVNLTILPFRDVGRLTGIGFLAATIVVTLILQKIYYKSIILFFVFIILLLGARLTYFTQGLESDNLPNQPGLNLRAVDLSFDRKNLKNIANKFDNSSGLKSNILFLPNDNYLTSNEFGNCFNNFNSFPNYISEIYEKPIRNSSISSYKINNPDYSQENLLSRYLDKDFKIKSEFIESFDYIYFDIRLMSNIELLFLWYLINDSSISTEKIEIKEFKDSFKVFNKMCKNTEIQSKFTYFPKINPKVKVNDLVLSSEENLYNFNEDQLAVIALYMKLDTKFEEFMLNTGNAAILHSLAANQDVSFETLEILMSSPNDVISQTAQENFDFLSNKLNGSVPELEDANFNLIMVQLIERRLNNTKLYYPGLLKISSTLEAKINDTYTPLSQQILLNFRKPNSILKPEYFVSDNFVGDDRISIISIPMTKSKHWKGQLKISSQDNFDTITLVNDYSNSPAQMQNFKISESDQSKLTNCSRINNCVYEFNFWFGYRYLSLLGNIAMIVLVLSVLSIKVRKILAAS